LQIVCPIVGVAGIVGRRSVSSACLERDPETSIVVDGIAEDLPAGIPVNDADAVEAVEGDDVALACARTAYHPTRSGRGFVHVNATQAVAKRHRPRDVGADVVTLDDEASWTTLNDDAIAACVYHIAGG